MTNDVCDQCGGWLSAWGEWYKTHNGRCRSRHCLQCAHQYAEIEATITLRRSAKKAPTMPVSGRNSVRP